ncbi:MAG: Hsp20/alpha crystallin family protein [Desulfomonile sp.]|nr:Hsp20/alpha crystallin family protein [Desulfomonile sp.]
MPEQELKIPEKKEIAPPAGEFTREGSYYTPAVDIYETPQELVMLVDMPGVRSDDVEIDLNNSVISIVGKVPVFSDDSRELLTEYCTGNYFRSFRITEVVDQSRISASMSDGVLKLTLPKLEKAVPRKIAIQSA